MSDESHRFRMRAQECRRLAADAKDGYSRRTLTQMADELEAEADESDAVEATPGRRPRDASQLRS